MTGEKAEIYRGHVLHSADKLVTCPVLYSHVCEICGATGVHAHTRKHCPNDPGTHNLATLPARQ